MKPIENIEPGELVLSKDARTGGMGFKRVLSVSKRVATLVLAITLLSGAKLEVTPEHPFWLADGIGGWVPASQLKGRHLLIERIPGEGEKPAVVIYGQNGQALPADVVMSVEERIGSFTVHNMIVEDWHSYVVAGGVVVHNGCKPKTPHTIKHGGKSARALETGTPNSIHEQIRPDGSKSVTYFDDAGRAFSREDYGQQRTHGVLGKGSDGKSVPHEHRTDFSDKGPIGSRYRELDAHGKPVGPWYED